MQRYFLEEIITDIGSPVAFSKEQSHHLTRVLRMKAGQIVQVIDTASKTYEVSLMNLDGPSVTGQIMKEIVEDRELPVHVTIVCGLPKGDKLELIVQKATELGVNAIIPWQSHFAISKWDIKKEKSKRDRLQKIALEASEQAYRQVPSKILPLVSTKELIQLFPNYDYVLVAFEEEGKTGQRNRLAKVLEEVSPGASLLVIFGPEGGISSDEIELFSNQQAILCGLGPRILRTETAPLYLLATISYEFEMRRI